MDALKGLCSGCGNIKAIKWDPEWRGMLCGACWADIHPPANPPGQLTRGRLLCPEGEAPKALSFDVGAAVATPGMDIDPSPAPEPPDDL